MKTGLRLWITIFLVIVLTGIVNPAAAANPTFSDISRHWARESINNVAALGHLSGYPDGTYRPDNSMTRAEFVTALISCLGAEHNDTITSNFNDTTKHWAKTQINEAVRRGILKPWEYPNGLKPDGAVKRSEVAAMLVRASGKTSAAKVSFKDNATIQQSDYRDYIRIACATKLMSGYTDGEFKPFNNMTRGQVAAVLANFLGLGTTVSAPSNPTNSGWSIVVDGNSYDLATTPVYFKSGYTDIKITSIASANGKLVFNNTYSFPIDSGTGNLDLVIYNTVYTVSKMSINNNQLLISSSSTRLNNISVGDYKYDASFVRLYISQTNGEHYLSDAALLDQYTLKIDGKTYDLTSKKVTIVLGDKYYDIKKIIFSSTITSLQLSETDAVVLDGLRTSDISEIWDGNNELDMDRVDQIDFVVNHSMYRLSQVTIDASGNFTAGGTNYPCSEVTMIIDGSYYKINSITMYKGKFIINADEDEAGNLVLFNNEYRLASEIRIIKDSSSYTLDQVIIVDRNLIRIGGKQYTEDSVKCRFNNKVYDIDEIDYDTEYDIPTIEAAESSDYAGAYQPNKYTFYYNDAVYQTGTDNAAIYVKGAYRKFSLINIIDPGHFSYNDDTYDMIDSHICIGTKYFDVIDTVWHGQSQTFDLYLEKQD
ncbi:MAG TPA: S-layer homology domain-containing protein [Syntrophomonadaceae bacterium]|nr:S-layer homology domain-containing protein [Syntrophomonadaceae bacterium]